MWDMTRTRWHTQNTNLRCFWVLKGFTYVSKHTNYGDIANTKPYCLRKIHEDHEGPFWLVGTGSLPPIGGNLAWLAHTHNGQDGTESDFWPGELKNDRTGIFGRMMRAKQNATEYEISMEKEGQTGVARWGEEHVIEHIMMRSTTGAKLCFIYYKVYIDSAS